MAKSNASLVWTIIIIIGAVVAGTGYYFLSDNDSNNSNSEDIYPLNDDELPAVNLPINSSAKLTGITPFRNSSFSFPHFGIDFRLNGTTQINSPTKMYVYKIEKYHHPSNTNWQVNIGAYLNQNWSFELYFEPWAANETAIDTILSTFVIHVNTTIETGALIGQIYPMGEDCRVHISVVKNGIFVCPYTYFTESAKQQFDPLFTALNTDTGMGITQPCN